MSEVFSLHLRPAPDVFIWLQVERTKVSVVTLGGVAGFEISCQWLCDVLALILLDLAGQLGVCCTLAFSTHNI